MRQLDLAPVVSCLIPGCFRVAIGKRTRQLCIDHRIRIGRDEAAHIVRVDRRIRAARPANMEAA